MGFSKCFLQSEWIPLVFGHLLFKKSKNQWDSATVFYKVGESPWFLDFCFLKCPKTKGIQHKFFTKWVNPLGFWTFEKPNVKKPMVKPHFVITKLQKPRGFTMILTKKVNKLRVNLHFVITKWVNPLCFWTFGFWKVQKPRGFTHLVKNICWIPLVFGLFKNQMSKNQGDSLTLKSETFKNQCFLIVFFEKMEKTKGFFSFLGRHFSKKKAKLKT